MNGYITANPSTQQTNTLIIPATAGKRVYVLGLYISSDTEQVVSLVNGSTHGLLHRLYVGAHGGLVLDFATMTTRGIPSQVGIAGAVGEGIDYTTSAAGNVFLGIYYRVE